MNLEYSAVIRTLGLAGDKYMRLLKSLDTQTIKPKEILVVLAEGYDLPPERLGYERYIYSKKGIVSQRSLGAIVARRKRSIRTGRKDNSGTYPTHDSFNITPRAQYTRGDITPGQCICHGERSEECKSIRFSIGWCTNQRCLPTIGFIRETG